MTISFSTERAASAAVEIIQRYGYVARAAGANVSTDCPALLAVSLIGRDVGLDRVEKVHLACPTGAADRATERCSAS